MIFTALVQFLCVDSRFRMFVLDDASVLIVMMYFRVNRAQVIGIMKAALKTVFAPAKVNLCLHVLGRRDDGYHELAMLMQRIALFDRLDIELVAGNDVTVVCPGLELADGEQNIVEKAVRLFLAHVALKQGVSVVMEKKIPAAAGLGGGSSDAAAVLQTLNQLLGSGLSRSELMGLGLSLGADVPFFLYGQTAWATGVGECLQPWPGLPPITMVLVNPGLPVSTPWAFRNLGLTRSRPIARIPRFPERVSDLVCLLHNDLEVVTCQHYPVITAIKERLIACGAKGALMSGSGATVFGVFDDRCRAEQAAQALSTETSWWVEVVNPL
jgi:4-diphosphocytidyl-2-C-methyl-D-erythritol kinase